MAWGPAEEVQGGKSLVLPPLLCLN